MHFFKDSFWPTAKSNGWKRNTRHIYFWSIMAWLLAFGFSTQALAQKQPRQTPNNLSEPPKTAVLALPLSISILYFDQSSYQLRPGVRQTLDSMAQYLVEQSSILATITAYTDNIGRHELNVELARQRAQAVKNYLMQHGVEARQILASWEGPDTEVLTQEAGTVKTIRRRVIVQLSPR